MLVYTEMCVCVLHNYENRLIYAADKLNEIRCGKRQGVEQLAIGNRLK